LRGWGIRIACGLAALVACLSLAESASAGKKTQRFLDVRIDARASNGYNFTFEAFRAQPGGGSATITFERENSSAFYILRRPAVVTKRRVQADFGEIGAVDLRYRSEFSDDRHHRGCERHSFSFGKFRGGLRIEGESGYSRVQQGVSMGAVYTNLVRGRCKHGGDEVVAIPYRGPAAASGKDILGSCGGASGAGFIAANAFFDQGSLFLASKSSRTKAFQVLRTIYAEGADRMFHVDGRTAKVRPPEPFEGRAELRGGELKGNLRAPLPGAGMVDLTPGDGSLSGIKSFEFPACFSPYYYAGGDRRASTRNAVAASLQRTALTSATRRFLAALGSR
jgi:hypothetical protein